MACVEIENSERVRAYEIAAYLSAASFPLDITDGPPANPVPSSDLTLNALVQHGAHVMDCDRAFLSLIDDRSQFICAEMTRNQPLRVQNPAQPLLLGTSRIALDWGVCPYTMSVFHGKTDDLAPNSPYVVASKSYICIKDFRQIPSFADRPYVVGYPHMVSYIEIPLLSLSGHILGSYCVVDNKPRDFLHAEALSTIREVTAAISSYLNTKRVEASRTRSERMMDGLRLFIGSEKRSSPQEHGAAEDSGAQASPFDLDVFGKTSQVGLDLSAEANKEYDRLANTSSNRVTSSDPTDDYFRCPVDRFSLALGIETTGIPNIAPSPPVTITSISPFESTSRTTQHESSRPTLQRSDDFGQAEPDPPSQIGDIFKKAATVVGYALDLDGLMFFDAVAADSQCTTNRSSSLFTDGERSESTIHGEDLLARPLAEYRRKGGAEEQIVRKLSQSMIQRLTVRYPQGHVFAIDNYGVLNYENDRGVDANQQPSGSIVADNDWREFLECVPRARYAIFMPLWHYQRESCFASCLAWVSSISKTLDNSDVNSLIAFGNSLMVEILRLEASANTQSKSDFVSSVSHELRSPLHGILATLELMQENTEDQHLLSMMEMIESCSSTLLDTFDHLLEFARINSCVNDAESDEKNRRQSSSSNSYVKKAFVDLGSLVEDVLEVVSLGHSSALQLESGLNREQQCAQTSDAHIIPSNSLLVTTNIEKNQDWVMLIEAGAWKRIVLSILSNAFKFTDSGYIDVSLKMSEKVDGNPQDIIFSVTDTGVGMSPEFLKYHLFMPFMQENNLSPGTGLGLAIAKNFVESLGGKIFVKSRKREGTHITIKIPSCQDSEVLNKPIIDSTIIEENKLQDVSLGLVSIAADGSTTTELTPRIIPPPKTLQHSIRNMCEGKFGMGVAIASPNAIPKTDLILLDLHALPTMVELKLAKLFPKDSSNTLPTSIVVLRSSVEGLVQIPGVEEVTYIDSPITEKKVRAAFLAASSMAGSNEPKSSTPHPVIREQETSCPMKQTLSEDLYVEIKTTAAQDENIGFSSKTSSHRVTADTEAQASKIPRQLQTSSSQETSTIETSSHSIMICRFRRFLLVDDNPINLKVLAAFAKRIGCPFSTAPNGAEALRLYRKAAMEEADPFDCVFMDISMPVMDGFQAVAAIRELERQQQQQQDQNILDSDSDRKVLTSTSRSYILALTGLGSEQARNTAKSSGFDEFLLKPVKFKDILPFLRPISSNNDLSES